MRTALVFALFFVLLSSFSARAGAEQSSPDVLEGPKTTEVMGDRIRPVSGRESLYPDRPENPSVGIPVDYRIGVGDIIVIHVRGDVDLHYGESNVPKSSKPQDNYEVLPDGALQLPVIGRVQAGGKTALELRRIVAEKLSAYYKRYDVDLAVSKTGWVKVWVGGQVANPGPRTLASGATVVEALLKADILSTGSTRLVKLTRQNETRIVDAYSIVALGQTGKNLTLEPNDQIYVPAVTEYVTIMGQVSKQGQFEMVAPEAESPRAFRISDLRSICLGLLPTAAPSHILVQRPSTSGEVTAVHVDLTAGDDPELMPGDRITVPSVSDYQPTVRLVGEFKGEGVYQRVPGTELNKTGVFRLAKGETAGDVITRTGGTTPQADLKRAKIERFEDGKFRILPLDLERVLASGDKSADIALQSGDSIVLPALIDKVFVFGQVQRPGGFAYEPDRRLVDYLGYAGGPSVRAKSSVVVVRGDPEKPEMLKINISKSMKGNATDNPILKPGDVVYVPERVLTDWRDVSSIVTTVRLLWLF